MATLAAFGACRPQTGQVLPATVIGGIDGDCLGNGFLLCRAICFARVERKEKRTAGFARATVVGGAEVRVPKKAGWSCRGQQPSAR